MDDRMRIFVGPASVRLGSEVCETLETAPAAYECRRFPDGEMQIEIPDSLGGRDVFLLQSTSPPVERHLMELLLLADACRRAGAGRLTAIIPYLGCARQDRRVDRRSLGARVMASLIATAGLDRLMLIDVHTSTRDRRILRHPARKGPWRSSQARPSKKLDCRVGHASSQRPRIVIASALAFSREASGRGGWRSS